jgi:hypothetical protein
MSFTSPDDEIDPMEDADDELEATGMHVLGEDDEDEESDVTPALLLEDDEEADALVASAEDDLDKPKDGLAELEEMEQAYLNGDLASEDEEEEI